MMPRERSNRNFLRALGLGVVVAVWGCSGKGGPSGPQEQVQRPPSRSAAPDHHRSTSLSGSATGEPADQKVENPWTYQVVTRTPYYKDGPQQMRPPDGQLEPGTWVRVIQEAGSYVLIETQQGLRAYVDRSALKKRD